MSSYGFKHNGATCHKANETIDFCIADSYDDLDLNIIQGIGDTRVQT